MTSYYIKGKGVRTHLCNCPHCTIRGEELVTIREYVMADTPKEAEYIILKREGDLLGDFWWLEKPEIYVETKDPN